MTMNIHTGTAPERWSAGEDEEAPRPNAAYSVAGLNIFDGRAAFEGTHFNAVEFYGRPVEVAQARRDRVLAMIDALRPFASIAAAFGPSFPDTWEVIVSADGEPAARITVGEIRAAAAALEGLAPK